jgi:hypothetical protein
VSKCPGVGSRVGWEPTRDAGLRKLAFAVTHSTQPHLPVPGPHGRWFGLLCVPALGLVGAIGCWILAASADDQPIASDFWSQILTVVGLSALPIVVVAMRVPAYATPKWRAIAAVSVFQRS